MAIVAVGQGASAGAYNDVHTSAQMPVGALQTFFDNVNNVYFDMIYLPGVASLAALDAVTYDEAYATTRAINTAPVGSQVAVAAAAVSASTSYGWFYRKGSVASVNCATATADNSDLYLSASAGRLSGVSMPGARLAGAIARSAGSSNTATVELNNPQVQLDRFMPVTRVQAATTVVDNNDAALKTGATLSALILPLFTWSVVAGATYVFDLYIPVTCTVNGGVKVAFELTTATLTSIRYDWALGTAVDKTDAIGGTGTTTTSATALVDSKAVAWTYVRVKGSFVVNAAGTFFFSAAQNAAHDDDTSFLIGAQATLTRVL